MRSWLYLIINNDWRWNEPVSGASLSAPPSPNASSSASSCHEVMKCVCVCLCVSNISETDYWQKKLRTFLSSIGSGDHFSRHGLLSSRTDISWAISSTIWQSGYQPNHIIYLPLPPPRHDGRFSSQKLPLNVECYKRKIWKKHRYANSFCCCYQRLGKKCQG